MRIRITEEQKIEMKKLKEKELNYSQIGKRFGVHGSCVNYHINEDYKKRSLEYAKKKSKSLTKKEQRERNKKYRDSGYFKKRYHENEDFRRSVINSNIKLQKKRKANGLCYCGNKLTEKKKNGKEYSTCERCRKRQRLREREKIKSLKQKQ